MVLPLDSVILFVLFVTAPAVRKRLFAIVIALPSTNPPPLTVRLLTLPEKKLAGKVIDAVLVNETAALLLLASTLPDVSVGATAVVPKVRVLAPTVNLLDPSASKLLMVTAPASVAPGVEYVLLSVRLLNLVVPVPPIL